MCLDLAVIESQREQDMFNDRIRSGKIDKTAKVYNQYIGRHRFWFNYIKLDTILN